MAQFVFLFYIFLTTLTAIFAIAFVVYAFRIRDGSGVKVFGTWMVLTTGWTFMHQALFMTNKYESALMFLRWEWAFQVLVPPTFLLFIMQYKGYRRWVKGWRRLLLYILPISMIATSLDKRSRIQIWDHLYINFGNNMVPIQYSQGSIYWLYWLFAYGCLFTALLVVLHKTPHKSKAFVLQLRTLMIAILVPMLMSIFSVFNHDSPIGFNAAPFSFTIGGVLVGLAIYRYRLFDLSPFYYQNLLDSLQDGIVVLDEDDHLLQANQSAARLLQINRTTHMGEPFAALLPVDSVWQAILAVKPVELVEVQINQRGEVGSHFQLSRSQIEEPNHEKDRVITIRDVTEEHVSKIAEQVSRATAEVRASQLDVLRKIAERLNQAVEVQDVNYGGLEQIVLSVGARFAYVVLADNDGKPRFSGGYRIPPLLEERFEKTPFCPPCISFKRFVSGEYQEPVAFIPCEVLKEISISYSGLVSIPLHLGERRLGVLNLVMAPNVIFSGDEIRLLQTVGDSYSAALERARLYEDAEHLATIDALTGLFNRRHYFQLAQNEFDRANRYQRAVSILMIDIDYFKHVNDRYGHLIGDQVLQQIANRFRASLRSSDFIGRYGGEEFVILMPETDGEVALQIAERIRLSITDRPFVTDKGEISLTISLGVGSKPVDQEDSLENVLEQADQALMVAKRLGRNTVSLWRDQDENKNL